MSLESNSSSIAAVLVRSTNSPAQHSLFVIGFFTLLLLAFFFPVIYHGHLLAVDPDGLYFYLPNYYSHKTLWDPLLLSGFPMMADPQTMTWYPPAAVLSLLPGTWNLFMLMGYVAGCSSMYGYVFSLTRSRFAALISGTVFGLSGFMIAHLVHTVIVQSAAWIPLMLWSLEKLRQKISARWFLIGALAIAMSFLGGHPQTFFFGLMLGGSYTIVFGSRQPRFLLAALATVMIGIGLTAIQFLPTAELARQSLQGRSFSEFTEFALPPQQALTLVFPFSFGGLGLSGLPSYFGAPTRTELTGYVGLLPLILAAVGLIASRHRSVALFWICVAATAFILATGDATPVARLIYHVPLLNNFRAPGRYLLDVTVALSVLSGLGIAAIVRQEISLMTMQRIFSAAGWLMLILLIVAVKNPDYRAAGIAMLVFLLSIVAMSVCRNRPTALWRRAFMLGVLLFDLTSFGWFLNWRHAALSRESLAAPALAPKYRSALAATNQRLAPFRVGDAITIMSPNRTRLWGVPNASGYDVLTPKRTRDLVATLDDLRNPLPWTQPNDKSLDLLAVRYVFAPPDESFNDDRGVAWSSSDLTQWLGSGCNQPTSHSKLQISLPAPVLSDSLAIVSRLACAAQLVHQTAFARVRVVDADGNAQTRDLLAGRDSSEWAYDCASVNPRHQRAQIFSSFPTALSGEQCEGHRYRAQFSWGSAKQISKIEFESLSAVPASAIIDKLSLIDNTAKTSTPVDLASANDRGWRLVETNSGARIFENLSARPRVWLVGEIARLDAAATLAVIKTGRLPDGRDFDPARTALVEEAVALPTDGDAQKTATLSQLSNDEMEVMTTSSRTGFLLTSDTYHPGWRATIDGHDAQIYRADYAIRGVLVPAGEHNVRFIYRPLSFYLGAAISSLCLLFLGVCSIRTFRSPPLPERKS